MSKLSLHTFSRLAVDLMRWRLVVALTGAFAASTIAHAENLGDAENGKRLYQECRSCHAIGRNAKNKVGPHLNNLFGRKAASVEGFRYSKSLERQAAGGLEWHIDTLHAFIENPTQVASGTRMRYRGMKDPQDRADLMAYLRQFSDSPANIPEADPTADAEDHDLSPEILALTGDPEYGEYLSGECTTCHQAGGEDRGIPSIVQWPEDVFVIAMHAYKKKTRAHPVMQMVAGRLGDEEIAALAAYFAGQELE